MRSLTYIIFFILTIVTVCSSCRQVDVFEKHETFAGNGWAYNTPVTGTFLIKDTNAVYALYIVIRHKDSYELNNIWLNVGLQSPGSTMYAQKINFTLGSDATGWEGIGMQDIWEVRKPLNDIPQRFKKTGTYHYSISQIMRSNPLPGIMSAGLRLEKK